MTKKSPLITYMSIGIGDYPPLASYAVVSNYQGNILLTYVMGDNAVSQLLTLSEAEQHANQILETVKSIRERAQTTS